MMRFKTRFLRIAWVAAAACWWAVGSPLLANEDFWKNAASGVWGTGSNWLDNTTPAGSDEATFDKDGNYTVTFNVDPLAIQDLNLTGAGNLTFTSNSFLLPSTLRVNSTSFSSVNVGGFVGNTSLTLGTSGGIFNPDKPLHLSVGYDLRVNSLATLNVGFGSDVITSYLNCDGQLNISGSGSTLNASSQAAIYGNMNVTNGGMVLNKKTLVNHDGTLTISGANSQWINSDEIIVGAANVGPSRVAFMNITSGGQVQSGSGSLGDPERYSDPYYTSAGAVTVSGTNSQWNNSGDLVVGRFSDGALTIEADGSVTNASGIIAQHAGSTGTATVVGAGSAWTNSSDLFVGGDALGQGGTGSLTVADSGLVEVGSVLKIWNGGTVTLDGGSIMTSSFDNSTGGTLNFVAGSLAINGGVEIGGNAFPLGLTLQPQQQVTTPATTTIAPLRTLRLDGGTLTTNGLVVNGALQFNSGTLELTGGAITGLTALTIPTNGEFRASGVQALRITSVGGSTIAATGNATLGDATKVNGFYSNGTVQVGAYTVTLADANDAVFDSAALLMLGDSGSPGTIDATNGLTLDFGGNITGFGTIISTNTLARRTIINGMARGNSPAEPLTFTGYVKGVGTFDNVNFTGTFDPGLSPAVLAVGNIAFGATSTLIMELGGTTPGSGYDMIQSSGAMAFDGALQVSVINGFLPAAGQSFKLFDWMSASGTFDTLQLPALAGLAWNTTQLYTTGTISLAAVALPSDYNQNGAVDAADYVAWRKSPGNFGGNPGGYNTWRTHFGQPPGGDSEMGTASNSAVPEPGGLGLLILAVPALLRHRRLHVSVTNNEACLGSAQFRSSLVVT